MAKLPSEYKVGDILRVAEGSLAPVTCLEDAVNQCHRSKECTTLEFWKGLADVINTYVDSYTLDDLLKPEDDTKVTQ